MGKNSGAMVYGVVMYDFKAERPDELDAKEGEAIIVIAQSNPEWFVAKPITRLGGPGLIPVSFIEIRDMATNQAVDNPTEAVRMAGVPKVEEWKKMAADYKNGSIPLGTLDGQAGQGALQQGMARMSLNGQKGQQQRGQPQVTNPNGYGLQVCASTSVTEYRSTNIPSLREMDHFLQMTKHFKTRCYCHRSEHAYLDTVLLMIYSGSSWKRRWRTGDIGSCRDYTRTFTTFKLTLFKPFHGRQEMFRMWRDHFHICLVR